MSTQVRTYEDRTAANTRQAAVIFRAFNEKPLVVEDKKTGETVRVWRAGEAWSVSNAELAEALSGLRVIEESELLLTIPPSGVKEAVSKKYLIRDGSLLWVTEKAAEALKLPRKVGGLKIRFAKAA